MDDNLLNLYMASNHGCRRADHPPHLFFAAQNVVDPPIIVHCIVFLSLAAGVCRRLTVNGMADGLCMQYYTIRTVLYVIWSPFEWSHCAIFRAAM